MRVTVVTHYFSNHGGGVERVAGRLCAELAQRYGFAMNWFASNDDVAEQDGDAEIKCFPVKPWKCVERLTGLPYPLWGPRALIALSRAIRKSDVVHIHDFSYQSSVAAAIFARVHGVPVLLTQHTGAVRNGNRVFGAMFWLLEQTLGRLMLLNASAVVCVSETTRTHMMPLVRDVAKISTVWNGLDFDQLRPIESVAIGELRLRLGLSADRRVVLFVGRRIQKKGINIVRGVAAAMPEVQFLIAGRGPCDPNEWSLTNVRAMGYVDAASMAALYKAADAVLLPSYSEGFPLVVQEALACGVSVLSTTEVAKACPPVSDLIFSRPVPLNDDPSEWTAALRGILESQTTMAIRQKRSQRARATWSWERCTAAYEQIFHRTQRALRSSVE